MQSAGAFFDVAEENEWLLISLDLSSVWDLLTDFVCDRKPLNKVNIETFLRESRNCLR